MSFQIHTGHDIAALAAAFQRDGYVQIDPVLSADDAQRIGAYLQKENRWNLVFNQGGKHFDMAAEQANALAVEDATRLAGAIHAQARNNFQYCYRNRPVFDEYLDRVDPKDLMHEFVGWLNGDAFVTFARAVTGQPDIAFADAQTTCFEPGHFLNEHDDSAPEKQRRAAYVFNFTPQWRIDWGGQLLLHTDSGDIRRGLRPAFNVLNLLAVPQKHSVAYVTPYAGARRLSVTGWLRAGVARR